MVPIARRNLLADKVKFLVALGGVTLAIVLILVIQSLYYGVRRESASIIRALPGDLWVTQKGTTDIVFSNSHLPEEAGPEIAILPEVTAVHHLYGRLMSFDVNGSEVRTYVMSLGPPQNPPGRNLNLFIPRPGTIIIDRTFAKQTGLSQGDVLRFNNAQFTVAQVRHVGNVLVTQFAFVHVRDFQRLFGIPGSVNFFLVSLRTDPTQEIMDSIAQKVEGSSVFTTDQFAERNSEKGTGDFLPIIRVIVVISFIVGLAVLSLTIYSATIERAREYAIMKVLGASHLRLYRVVLTQSAIIAILGFAAGVGLAFPFNRVAANVVPQFITYIRWQDVAFVLGAAAVMSFIASYVPINRVARLDPASVFRA